jgi:hypothetical protein
MDETTDFTLVPKGPFSLAASTRFLEGFAPAAYDGERVEPGAEAHLDLAFPVEGDWRTVGVRVRQADDGTVAGEVVGDADPGAVRAQVARILSLDVDGSEFPRAMVRAYGLEAQPAPELLHAIAERWRPYRTWVSLLLRTELEDETHEITGQRR